MLSPEEKRKLAISDNDYLKTFHNHDPDIPKAEMAKSESKSKYAFSLCRRATYNISPEIHLPEEKREPLGMVARDGLPPGSLPSLSDILQLEKDCPGLDVRLPQGWKKIVSETGESLYEFTYEEENIIIETQESKDEFPNASIPNPEEYNRYLLINNITNE